jgi:hypothetical protein
MGHRILTGDSSPVSAVERSLTSNELQPRSRAPEDRTVKWNRTTYSALLMLVVLWAVKVYMTWAAWGNLTIDSGHEMYIPGLLAQGKQLYRDVWFMYGPAAPYFTSQLFRLFGANLNVLYWAGSFSALGSAIFLFLTAMQLTSWLIGWTAGAVLLMEAFQPSLFCFPLPYTSAAVYACFVGCLFLWLVINALDSGGWAWTFAAGTAAAIALLLKPEFGTACYGTLGLMVASRSLLQRSWRLLARDTLAILPGIIFCGLVIRWMVSIAGVEFITHENLVFWPSSYFMKTYGKMWLAQTGFTVTGSAFQGAISRAMPLADVLLVAYCFLWWKRTDKNATFIRVVMVLTLILYAVKTDYFLLPLRHAVTGPSLLDALSSASLPGAAVMVTWCLLRWQRADRLAILMKVLMVLMLVLAVVKTDYFSSSLSYAVQPLLTTIFFPQDMVLYVAIACGVAWLYFWLVRRNDGTRSAAIPLILTYSSLLAFRVLMKMAAHGYPIFYNGPVVLSFLLLLCPIIPRSGRSRAFVFVADLIICLACLTAVALQVIPTEAAAKDYVPLTTEQGTVRVPKNLEENYKVAIQFMQEKASLGESVLSVPEDTSLYFLSGTYCPTRVMLFVPGVVAPGEMTDDMIREIDQKPVRYLLWSNRSFPEFGVPIFGKDFDTEIGDYLKSHYHLLGPLRPSTGNSWDWAASVWERNTGTEVK